MEAGAGDGAGDVDRAQGGRLGLVVGGTGIRGFAQAGAIGALERGGLPPDVVVGVSTGAIVAAAYAARPDWSAALLRLDRTRLPAFSPNGEDPDSLARLRALMQSARRLAPSVWTWGRQGYGEYAREALTELLGEQLQFDQTRVPLAQVATDLERGGRRVITAGDVAEATLAASALPTVTRPVEIEGHPLVDGAFGDPVPVDVARSLGADVVLVVHAGADVGREDPENWMVALVRGVEIGQYAFAEERLSDADRIIRADLGRDVRSLDFNHLDVAVRRTASAVRSELDEVRRQLGRR